MRRTRNLIALLMAAVMCLCLFAGCGKDEETTAKPLTLRRQQALQTSQAAR